MRLSVVALLLLLGCGDATGPRGPAHLDVQLDAACTTLTRTHVTIGVEVDGTAAGLFPLAPGEYQPLLVDLTPGAHVLHAFVADFPLIEWGPVTATLQPGQRLLFLLRCPAP